MYGDLVTQNLLTGEALAGMVSRQGNIDFVVSLLLFCLPSF